MHQATTVSASHLSLLLIEHTMKILGILIILNALILCTYWVIGDNSHKSWAVGCALMAIFAGIFLLVSNRETEVSIEGVGTIKAAAEAALADADAIAKIKARVESQSATIDLVAQDAKEVRKLTEEVRSNGLKVEEQVKNLDTAFAKANEQTSELNFLLEFTNTVVAAQTDERSAYDKLREWANDEDHRFTHEAQQAYQKIMDDHSNPWTTGGFTVPWKEGFDPSRLNIKGLTQQYHSASAHLRPALLEYIWNRNDISKYERMDFLVHIIRTDSSLNAVERAGRYFTNGAEINIKPLAIDHLLKWWNENKESIKNEPQQSE